MFKHKKISLKEAQEAYHLARTIPIRFVFPDMAHAISIAHEQEIYAYDAYMLAASEEYRAPLLTLDLRLRQTAKLLKLKLLEV